MRLNCPLMPSPPSPWSSRQHERAEDAPASDSNVRMRRIQMAATLIVLARLFWAMSPLLQQTHWMKMIAAMSVLSMIVGNAVAIVQRDLKRMLAYSGIAHVGYMMLALLTIRDESVAAVTVYVITYALMNIGAFGVVSMLAKNQNDPQTLEDVAGLGFRRPFYGLALTICEQARARPSAITTGDFAFVRNCGVMGMSVGTTAKEAACRWPAGRRRRPPAAPCSCPAWSLRGRPASICTTPASSRRRSATR